MVICCSRGNRLQDVFINKWRTSTTEEIPFMMRVGVLVLALLLAPSAGAGDLLFSASFDDGFNADYGLGTPQPVYSDRIERVQGRTDLGLWVKPNEWIFYQIEGNLHLAEGTLALWVKPHFDFPHVRSDYGEASQCVFSMRIRSGQALELKIQHGADQSELVLYSAADKERQSQVRLSVSDWKAGEWHRVIVSWKQPSHLSLAADDTPPVTRQNAHLPNLPERMFYDIYFGTNSVGSAHARMEHLDATLDDIRIYRTWQRQPDESPVPEVLESVPLRRPGTSPRWVGKNRYRMNFQVDGIQKRWKQVPIAVSVTLGNGWENLDSQGRRAAIDSLRLVQFDLRSGHPHVWNTHLRDDSRFYRPFQIDDQLYWKNTGLVRWIHENHEPVGYSLYYDPAAPYDAPFPLEIPMIGNGDRLHIGKKDTVDMLSGSISGVFDVADIDGDGDLDIWMNFGTLQTRACLDLMNGHYFYENLSGKQSADSVFAPPQLIIRGNTLTGYISGLVLPHISDVNQDGKSDLLMCGRSLQEWWEWEIQRGRPVITAIHPLVFDGAVPRDEYKTRLYDWDQDGLPDMMAGRKVFLNVGQTGNPVFNTRDPISLPLDDVDSAQWYFFPVDWDGDGDMDFISSGWNHQLYFHENIGSQTDLRIAEARRLVTFDFHEIWIPDQLIQINVLDWDGDGDLDILWSGEKSNIGFLENIAAPGEPPKLKQTVFLQQLRPMVDSGSISIPVFTDWDSDGDLDLVLGGSGAYLFYHENLGSTRQPVWSTRRMLEAGNTVIELRAGPEGSVQGPLETGWGYNNPEVADWDGDGLLDVLISGIRGDHHFFRNIGTTSTPRLSAGRLLEVDWGEGEPLVPQWLPFKPQGRELLTVWRTRPVAMDWNADGLTDYITLDHEGELALYERFCKADGSLGLLPGKRIFSIEGAYSQALVWNRPPGEAQAGRSGRTVINLVDWDRDGDFDLILDNLNGRYYENIMDNSQPHFVDRGDLVSERLANHNTAPFAVDWDGDGWHDLFVGTESGQVYYFHRAYIEKEIPQVHFLAVESRYVNSKRR